MTQKQLSRFMLDLDEWDNEEDKRIFDISAGKQQSNETDDETLVFTSFKLSKSQYSELLNEIQSYNQGSDGNATQFEIQEDPLVLMCELDDIHVQLFFENKNEILEFQNFLSENK